MADRPRGSSLVPFVVFRDVGWPDGQVHLTRWSAKIITPVPVRRCDTASDSKCRRFGSNEIETGGSNGKA